MKSTVGYLFRADGSCLYSQGNTTVLTSVNGPGDLKASRQISDSALVQASVRSAVASTSGPSNAVISQFVEKLCQSVIVVRSFPKTLISIVVQELENDGCLMEAAVNSACLALVDSGLPIRDTFAAATVALTKDDKEHIVLNPTDQVQQNALALMVAVFMEHQTDAVYATWTRGTFTQQTLEICIRKVEQACASHFARYKSVLAKFTLPEHPFELTCLFKCETLLINSQPTDVEDKPASPILLKTFQGTLTTLGSPPEVYDFNYVESEWYEWWMKNNFFNPTTNAKQFTMLLPPPNVTGDLHVGHALTVAIEDCVARTRMCGQRVSWIPGFDHAGLALQLCVEKDAQTRCGLLRKSMGRDHFEQLCKTWANARMASITDQLQRLGASLDWPKLYYTLDENFSRAVCHALKQLHQAGLLYRDYRVVNWSPALESCLSDVEVETRRIDHPTEIAIPNLDKAVSFGYMYFVKYPICDQADDQHLIVATTRPETILADVGLAVHPDDSRYAKCIGLCARNPLIPGKRLPIIADSRVSRELATGVMKLSPAHSQLDLDIVKSHNLPLGNGCISSSGHLIAPPSEFDGMERFRGRDCIVNALIDRELLVDCQSQPMKIPICRRTGDVLEPMAKEQWFLSCTQMAERALDALAGMQVQPEGMRNEWKNWLSHRVDWCLSRQSWWGHRVPAFKADYENGTSLWLLAANEQEAKEQAAAKRSGFTGALEQDPDMLDTWFSSALIPLVVDGWPDRVVCAQRSFPLSLMETGHDILGFWVARMVMLSQFLTNQLPFRNVLYHGLLRDSQGQKMSKSQGNVVDPMQLIGKNGRTSVGADALRIALLKTSLKSGTVVLDDQSIQRSSKFCNKLWQSFKYIGRVIDPYVDHHCDFEQLGVMDKWILSRLHSLIRDVHEAVDAYNLHTAVEALISFWWLEFCDIYLEWSKSYFYPKAKHNHNTVQRVLVHVAEAYLRLISPYMPYIAEQLYNQLPIVHKGISVHATQYPKPDDNLYLDPHLELQMRFVREVMHSVRSYRKDMAIAPSVHLKATAVCAGIERAALEKFSAILEHMVHLRCKHVDHAEVPEESVALISQEGCQIHLEMLGVIDQEELVKRFDRLLHGLMKKRNKLSNKLNALRRQAANGDDDAEARLANCLRDVESVDKESQRLAAFRRNVEAKRVVQR